MAAPCAITSAFRRYCPPVILSATMADNKDSTPARNAIDLIKYVVPRLELSYTAIEIFIEKLSDKVTETGRAPSVPLARDVVEELGWANPDSAAFEDD